MRNESNIVGIIVHHCVKADHARHLSENFPRYHLQTLSFCTGVSSSSLDGVRVVVAMADAPLFPERCLVDGLAVMTAAVVVMVMTSCDV